MKIATVVVSTYLDILAAFISILLNLLHRYPSRYYLHNILQYQYLILDMKIELEKHFKLHKVHKKTEVTANR